MAFRIEEKVMIIYQLHAAIFWTITDNHNQNMSFVGEGDLDVPLFAILKWMESRLLVATVQIPEHFVRLGCRSIGNWNFVILNQTDFPLNFQTWNCFNSCFWYFWFLFRWQKMVILHQSSSWSMKMHWKLNEKLLATF